MPSVFDDPNFCHPLSDPRHITFSEFTLRKALMDAIKIREESWETNPKWTEMMEDPLMSPQVLSPGKYKISTEEAARQACLNHKLPFTLAPLIWLAISEYSSVSNDTQTWASGEYDSFFNQDGTFKEEFSNPPAKKEKKVVKVTSRPYDGEMGIFEDMLEQEKDMLEKDYQEDPFLEGIANRNKGKMGF